MIGKDKNAALKIAHKIELWTHIKRFGQLWGEDEDTLQQFGKDVYNAYKDDLEIAIKCFVDLADQAVWLTKLMNKNKPAAG